MKCRTLATTTLGRNSSKSRRGAHRRALWVERPRLLTAEQRHRRRLVVRSVLGAVLVGALFFGVLPQVADLSSVWTHIGAMSVMQLFTLGAVAVASLLAYGLVLMAVMPGLTFAQATVVSQSSTAVANTMPAGGALAVGVSYRFYGSWGFSNAAITRNVVVTGHLERLLEARAPRVRVGAARLDGWRWKRCGRPRPVVGVVVLVLCARARRVDAVERARRASRR